MGQFGAIHTHKICARPGKCCWSMAVLPPELLCPSPPQATATVWKARMTEMADQTEKVQKKLLHTGQGLPWHQPLPNTLFHLKIINKINTIFLSFWCGFLSHLLVLLAFLALAQFNCFSVGSLFTCIPNQFSQTDLQQRWKVHSKMPSGCLS